MNRIKKLLLSIWNHLLTFKDNVHQKSLFRKDQRFVRKNPPPKVMSIEETMDKIIQEKLSVARFGDGEMKLASGLKINFQSLENNLSERLNQVLSTKKEGFLVCVPDVFGDRHYMLDGYSEYWKKHLSRFRKHWYRLLHKDYTYGNAFLSRCYMILRDKSRSKEYFDKMKQIWDGKDILLIEGEKSRLGVGNDLFANAKSIERILGPVENAYDKYDAILEAAVKHAPGKLVLLALGPTASVLSYDLFEKGFHAIDLGHADVEYEWFLRGATRRVPIKNKFVNEAGGGRGVGELMDDVYQSQIVERIL